MRRGGSLDALLQQVRACQLCADSLEHAPRPVLQASRSAQILIAGQAPGRRVHVSGVPFDDPSGDRLRNWLGVDAATFYDPAKIAILPMGFCYPGHGKSGDLPPRKECAPAWREMLLDKLPHIQLTLVLGQYALDYHLDGGEGSLTATVANWRAYWPEFLPLPHPSPRNNIWLRRNPWFEQDVIPHLQQRIATLLD
ncbi:MAG: uracil-DNA glycosylase family protein [Oceanococcus sp.]|nr:MAG: uracil-DNA glycosylase family protein [Oceanococcus sp.]